MNLWLDTGGDRTFFAFDGNGLLTSLAGDSYGGHERYDVQWVGCRSTCSAATGLGTVTRSAELQAGLVPGITGNTVVALWIGITGPPNPAVVSGFERQDNAPSSAQTAGGGSVGGRGWVGGRLAHWLELRRTVPPVSLGVTGRLVEGNTSGSPQRYSFYSPELNLLSETEVTAGTPTVAYDYIWFGGQPVAQVESSTGAVSCGTSTTTSAPRSCRPTPRAPSSGAPSTSRMKKCFSIAPALRSISRCGSPGRSTTPRTGEREYNIFRWYKPQFGRFDSVDPAGAAIADPQSWNWYGYVMGNPIAMIDPTGRCTLIPCLNYGTNRSHA